jgi:hypothetical protein
MGGAPATPHPRCPLHLLATSSSAAGKFGSVAMRSSSGNKRPCSPSCDSLARQITAEHAGQVWSINESPLFPFYNREDVCTRALGGAVNLWNLTALLLS